MEFRSKLIIQENEKYVFPLDWLGPYYEFCKTRNIVIPLG
jgi:hypothetical protein